MKKKRYRIRKALVGLLIVFLCFVLGIFAFFGVKGYRMYQVAIAEKSLDERVEEIRNTDNFTTYSDLPQFYIEATISVEDHRFEEHHGIDLIAIARAAWTDIRSMSFVEGGVPLLSNLLRIYSLHRIKKWSER